jgi:outer membrane protein assembly factor BamB
MILRFLLICGAAASSTAAPGPDDWPTQRHDNRRSGATSSPLGLPLTLKWSHQAGVPRQAWAGPAKWDAFSGNDGLQSMRNFDPCHHLTIASGRVYFGSSADDAAHCLDAASGKVVWSFFTNGPVRLPPTLTGDLALFGSDDGHAYGVDSSTGSLRWRKRAAPSDRLIASNGRMISPWPVRTGVLVRDGKAWFAASLVPWEKSYLWCVDAATGSTDPGGFVAAHKEMTLQGAMLSGGDLVFVPQGRSAPLAFKFADGAPAGTIGHAGGVTCVLTDDNSLLAGPQNQKSADNQIRLTQLGSKKPLATFNHTNRVTVAGTLAYLHSRDKLRAVDLGSMPTPTELWSVPHAAPVELIVAGSHLIVGLNEQVAVLDAASGKTLSTLEIDGTAHGLAVAGGGLFVSTSRGTIHAFAP